jgi:hypothetical protein
MPGKIKLKSLILEAPSAFPPTHIRMPARLVGFTGMRTPWFTCRKIRPAIIYDQSGGACLSLFHTFFS